MDSQRTFPIAERVYIDDIEPIMDTTEKFIVELRRIKSENPHTDLYVILQKIMYDYDMSDYDLYNSAKFQ